MQVLFQWNGLESLRPTSENVCHERSNRPFATNDHMVQNPPSKLVYGVRVLEATIQGIAVLKRHGNKFLVYPTSVLLIEL